MYAEGNSTRANFETARSHCNVAEASKNSASCWSDLLEAVRLYCAFICFSELYGYYKEDLKKSLVSQQPLSVIKSNGMQL
jgi:hypothetical protein